MGFAHQLFKSIFSSFVVGLRRRRLSSSSTSFPGSEFRISSRFRLRVQSSRHGFFNNARWPWHSLLHLGCITRDFACRTPPAPSRLQTCKPTWFRQPQVCMQASYPRILLCLRVLGPSIRYDVYEELLVKNVWWLYGYKMCDV